MIVLKLILLRFCVDYIYKKSDLKIKKKRCKKYYKILVKKLINC